MLKLTRVWIVSVMFMIATLFPTLSFAKIIHHKSHGIDRLKKHKGKHIKHQRAKHAKVKRKAKHHYLRKHRHHYVRAGETHLQNQELFDSTINRYDDRGELISPFTQKGVASFYGYGDNFNKRRMANGDRFNAYGNTVAHRSLAFGTKVRVTNTDTGKSVIATVTDRGPFHGGRIVDVSYGLAKKLGMVKDGTCNVKIEKL